MMDMIQAFGLSCVVSIVFLITNLIHLHLEDSNPDSIPEILVRFLLLPLAFFSFPSNVILFLIIYLYCVRREDAVSKEEQQHYRSVLDTYARSAELSRSDYEDAKNTISSLRSEIKHLKEKNDNLSSKLFRLEHDGIDANYPLVNTLRSISYDSGYDSGYRVGYYDGYIECKSDISEGLDRTDEVYDLTHPTGSDSPSHSITSESLSE